jgi:hypothetical protein
VSVGRIFPETNTSFQQLQRKEQGIEEGAALHIRNKSAKINMQISFQFFMHGEQNSNLY